MVVKRPTPYQSRLSQPVMNLSMKRSRFMFLFLSLAFLLLALRALYVQVIDPEFLQEKGQRWYTRDLSMPASRGKIIDRNDFLVASNRLAKNIWVMPEEARAATPEQVVQLADLLQINVETIQRRIAEDKKFIYLRQNLDLETAKTIEEMKIPGIHQLSSMQRHYPEEEIFAHVVGFTNQEGDGQEGIELSYNNVLQGLAGHRRVFRDRLGRVIEEVGENQKPVDGQDIYLSIDGRIQSLVYRNLKDAVVEHQAKGGSAVVLDVQTGEILALVNYPSFNPNDRKQLTSAVLRNRAVTDMFEPGSTMKPFTMATALNLGKVKEADRFDTGNGKFQFGTHVITDVSANGVLDLRGILKKSSNIGMTKISLLLTNKEIWEPLNLLGFGRRPVLDFPGLVAGNLRPYQRWQPIEKATMSYGYGLSLSLIQLARAYTVFARDGDIVPLSLLKVTDPSTIRTVQVYRPEIARLVRSMLEDAAGPEGASRAQVEGYRVGGKSGTARKIIDGQYSRQRYVASFVGFAPASDPKIVVAVLLDEPQQGGFFGGRVAAPVFSKIVSESLSIMLKVVPDATLRSVRTDSVGRSPT